MATADVATTMEVVVEVEVTIALTPTPQPNEDCVLPLAKTFLTMDTRQQLMR